jgi:hypothetical protein
MEGTVHLERTMWVKTEVDGEKKWLKYLNDVVLLCMWIAGVLYVALSNNTKMPHDVYCGCSEKVVLSVSERLAWCYNNRFTCVDTQRVHILHVANLQENRTQHKQNMTIKQTASVV